MNANALPRPTRRLVAHRWRYEDRADATALWGDPAVTRWISTGTVDPEAWLAREIATEATHGMQYWRWCLHDGTFVGAGGLRPTDDRLAGRECRRATCTPTDPAMPELGVHVLRACWRQGIAREIAVSVIAHAFDDRRVEAIFAGHHPDNEASRSALAGLGFVPIGVRLYAPTGREHPSYRLRRP